MEPFGLLTEGIDYTLVILYTFWIFFAALVFYLLREGRREGYPLIDDITGKQEGGGLIWIPSPKTFVTSSGDIHLAPDRAEVEPPIINAVPAAPFPGSPLVPVGNPLTAGVGPGAFAMRVDHPDLTAEKELKIVPMRVLPEHWVAPDDADPRGMDVVGADGRPAGSVVDMWVDRSEMLVRYLEVTLDAELPTPAPPPASANRNDDVLLAEVPAAVTSAGATILLPMNAATVSPLYGQVTTPTILAAQFVDVPRIKDPVQVTLLEEEKIMAYFAAGELYATADRAEPLL
ncbi:MAG: photosynthetic reaction center subunit H [Pseudomonadota bacterium]